MNRPLALLIIGLIFGGGIGFTIAAGAGVTLDGHDHAVDHGSMEHGETQAHDHSAVISLPAVAGAPTLAVAYYPDTASGFNLELKTSGFRFAPENVGGAHIPGEGHAHVYVNGKKRARVYGNWYHLETVPEGDVEVRVTLNSNDHSQLAVEDDLLEAVILLPASN